MAHNRIHRPFFRRGLEYVAVRPIRLSSATVVQPGEDVSHLRAFHLKSLYDRRRIGLKGHAWTERMLADRGSFARPEAGVTATGATSGPAAIVDMAPDLFATPGPHQDAEGRWVVGEEAFEDLDDALLAWHGLEAPSASTDVVAGPGEASGPPEPEKSGSQWTIAGVDGKFPSKKKAVEAWEAAREAGGEDPLGF